MRTTPSARPLRRAFTRFNEGATYDLGSLVATLTTPSPLTEGAVNYFEAPADTTLDPGTRFILNFHSTGDADGDLVLGLGTSNDEAGTADWLIEDDARSDGTQTGAGVSFAIEVRGHSSLSSDAALSALGITDSNSDAVTLLPAFQSDTHGVRGVGRKRHNRDNSYAHYEPRRRHT